MKHFGIEMLEVKREVEQTVLIVQLRGAPADEMDNFKLVAIVNGSGIPSGTWNDSAIELNGKAVGFGPEMLDQCGNSWEVGELLVLPINVKAHENNINGSELRVKGQHNQILKTEAAGFRFRLGSFESAGQ